MACRACGAGSAGEEMQEARDGQLKIVDRATRDMHSVAWMLRRAVGRAGARTQQRRIGWRRRIGSRASTRLEMSNDETMI